MMKYRLLTIIAFWFVFFAGKSLDNQYSVIPQPTKLIALEGCFKISSKTNVVVDSQDEIIYEVVNTFIQQLNLVSNSNLQIDNKMTTSKNSIVFVENLTIKDEAYRLEVTKENIRVEASNSIGFFYAIQTLYQLLPIQVYGKELALGVDWKVPSVLIEDAPLYTHRGVLLDMGRHFYPVEFVKQFIDLMSMYKLNKLQWHLTEDQGWRIEIKKYPRLTEIGSMRSETMVARDSNKFDGKPHGGYYTQAEAKEIVKYAAERGVTVIPEIELPGHSLAAIASYPELSCGLKENYQVGKTWGVIPDVYCPKETTFQFLEDVFSELFEIFPSEYYHIGGDECPKDSWKKCSHCQELMKKEGLRDEHELQSYFVKRIERFLNANGKQIIGWDEILEGGLAPNASVTVRNGEKTISDVANSNHDVIVTYAYLDYHQEHELQSEDISIPGGFLSLEQTYKHNITPVNIPIDKKIYIKGVQACVWTEYIQNEERLIRQVFPRLFAFSEVAWGTAKEEDYDLMRKTIVRANRQLEQLGFKSSDSFLNPIFEFDRWWVSEYPKELKLSVGYPYAQIYYTRDGQIPSISTQLYSKPIQVSAGDIISAGAFEDGKLVGKIRTYNFK